MDRILNTWLKEGYAAATVSESKVKSDNILASVLTNGDGYTQQPKPLFPLFLDMKDSEPDFMPKHLLNLEKKYRRAATFKFEHYFSKESDQECPKGKISEGKRILIEYDRKNIFLSRVIFNLFEIPDSSVLKGSAHYPKVVERNALYQNAVERHQNFPENFIEESVQTEFIDVVDKEIETMPMIFENKSCMINNYLLKVHYNRLEIKVTPPPKTLKQYFDDKTKFSDYKEFLINIDNNPEIFRRTEDILYVMEKTLDYNTYKNSILQFNGCKTDLENLVSGLLTTQNEKNDVDKLQSSNDADELQSPNKVNKLPTEQLSIEHHISFYFKMLNNYFQVTWLECNPLHTNIFAAGYGVSRFKEMDHELRGIILCWNIHKSGYPEKIFYTEEVITCMEFSKNEPYHLAVGMRYGLIAVFDLRRSETIPLVNNYASKVKPISTIKSICWIEKKYAMGKEMEILVSVSMDGTICSWTVGRNLVGHVLRYIKRGGIATNEEHRFVLAVDAAGMCMQFKLDDNEIFLVGTCEGEVLQSNINNLDSYSYEYKCHNGALYDLQWSPLVHEVFMTTGTDRFIHIWQMYKKAPSKSLTSDDIVLKVAWSRVKSTLFATLSKTRIFIFDLSIDLRRQIAECSSKNNAEFTFFTFCSKNNWFLTGQSDGIIDLYELVNIPELSTSQEMGLKKVFLSD